jgi:hypothetical protein
MIGPALYGALTLAIATLLTVCDALAHVRFHALHYTRPEHLQVFAGQPTGDVFVGFLRIAAFCSIAGWLFARRAAAVSAPKALAHVVAFVAVYFASGAFGAHPMSLHVAFLVLWSAQLATFNAGHLQLVLLSVLLGAAGPSFEGLFVELDFFAYEAPHAYHVPLWLSPLYMNGALAVAASARVLEAWRAPKPTREPALV